MIYNRPVAKGLFVLVSVYFGVRCMVSMVFGVDEEIFKKSPPPKKTHHNRKHKCSFYISLTLYYLFLYLNYI